MWWCSLWFTIIGVFVAEAADGDVQLVGSPRTYMGRVEIELGSTWYAICNVGWGIEEADVVCKQLGFPDGAMFSSVFPRSDFGIGFGNMLWSNYQCSGSESNFMDCSSGASLSSTECTPSQDVAIICNVPAYLGCYGISAGTFPPSLNRVSSATGSIDLCLGACRIHSTYVAIGINVDQTTCYCFSGDYASLTPLPNDRCNNVCADDDRAACGGTNAYSIYPVTLGESGTTYTDVDNDFIYSPNFFGLYTTNLATEWTISFSDKKIVTLKSIMFLLERDDFLTVSDGTPVTYDNNQNSIEWTSVATMSVSLEFTSAEDSDGNFGFIIEFTTSDAPVVTTEGVTTSKPATTAKSVTTMASTTKQDEPKTTSDQQQTTTVEVKTTESNVITTKNEVTTATKDGSTAQNDVTTKEETESTTQMSNTTPMRSTVLTTEPECPIYVGSSTVSNQVNTYSTDQLIISDTPLKCDTAVTEISFYASGQTTYTLFTLRQSQSSFIVVSKVDISSSSPGVVSSDLSELLVVGSAGDVIALAFRSGSFSYSENHSGTMNFTLYSIDYSDFDSVISGDTLDLPDTATNVQRQHPFKLTTRQSKRCDLPLNPVGGSYSASTLLEGQSTKLECHDGFRAKFIEELEDTDREYINVTCTEDGILIYDGSCQDDSYNTTYIVIFTTIVACLGFCLIVIYWAMICSKPDGKGGGPSQDIEKANSDENQLLPMDFGDDDVIDSPADEAEENEDDKDEGDKDEGDTNEGDKDKAGNDEEDKDADDAAEQRDGNQSNPASSAGDIGDVNNPVYESNDAMNANEDWVPEEAGPDD